VCGISAAELLEAGAVRVYEHPRPVLEAIGVVMTPSDEG
jgi:hypothetical protein